MKSGDYEFVINNEIISILLRLTSIIYFIYLACLVLFPSFRNYWAIHTRSVCLVYA